MEEMLNQKVFFRDIDKATNSNAYLKITPRVCVFMHLTCLLIVCEFARNLLEHPAGDDGADDPQEGLPVE